MLFVLSKVLWALIDPGNLLLIAWLFGAGALFCPLSRLRRAGRWTLAAAAVCALAIAVLPLGAAILKPLEERFAEVKAAQGEAVDGIVVLGGGIDASVSLTRHRGELNAAGDRVAAMVALALLHPEARIIYSGGSGSLLEPGFRGADGARLSVAMLGLDPNRIEFEAAARTTRENAILANALARPGPGEAWLLVTSAWHMPRAVGSFRAVGWSVTPFPVDYRTRPGGGPALRFDFSGGLAALSLGVKEWVGLLIYRVFGWSDALFPRPQK